jgi:hypothetical protein
LPDLEVVPDVKALAVSGTVGELGEGLAAK